MIYKETDYNKYVKEFERLKKIRGEIQSVAHDITVYVDLRKYEYEKDKNNIKRIRKHLDLAEILIHGLLKRMLKDITGNAKGVSLKK